MINKIESICNLGIYKNYRMDSKLQEFKKFNLFYGWNGSGKTTISKLFRIIEKKEIPEEYQNLKFKIEINSKKYDEKNYKGNRENIFVFNEDFINENISWDEKINKILILSKDKINESKEYNFLKEELYGNESTQTKGLSERFKEEEDKLDKKHKEIEDSYSKIAKNVKNIFQTIDPFDKKYSTLNKTKIEKIINSKEKRKEIIENTLTKEDVDKLLISMNNEKKELIKYIKKDIKKDDFIGLYLKIKEILEKIVTAKVIERLREHSDISNWVSKGLELNKKYGNEVCEFCGNPISNDRIVELENHFNDEVSNTKKELEELSEKLLKYNVKLDEIIINKNMFYKENCSKIDKLNRNIEEEVLKIDDFIEMIKQKIKEKIENPFIQIRISEAEEIEEILNNFNRCIESQETYVKETNDKTNNFEKQTREIKDKLELYYLKNEFQTENIINKIKDYIANKSELDKLKNVLNDKVRRLNELEITLSNETLGAEKFNEKLNIFIGYDELKLKFNNDLKGYEIIRKSTDSKASNLSEGEKTAIAFVYFLTKIKENDNQVENSIIVIDDPISSFDNNKLFSAYSSIRDEFDTCKQLFVFTHNFNFFKLIRDWINRKKNDDERYYSIYKIEPVIENGIRKGNIKNAGKSLNQTSEYDYVFDNVYGFKGRDLTETDIFNCGNACRKLLEAFLSFKFPRQRGDIKSLLDKAFPNKEENQNKIRIYKFINAYSHLNVIESDEISDIDTLLTESNGIVKIILDKIEELDPEHYKAMEHNSKSTSQI